jgi:DNA-binding HxlR family transcriptional regulator
MEPRENMPQLSGQECTSRLDAIGDAMYAIGGKWKLRIVIALMEGPKRFNDVQRLVKGISAKVLSSELKDLELNGFIKRKVYPGTPVAVEYEITEYSLTLSTVLDALSQWGMMHREKVKQSFRKETLA